MWQNKPRPIRIKALKRSLMLLKVPLNWQTDNMSCVEAGLNEEIGCPRWGPQQHLRSPTFLLNPQEHPWTLQKEESRIATTWYKTPTNVYFAVGFCLASLATSDSERLARCPCHIWTVARNQRKTIAHFIFYPPTPTPTFFLFLRTHKQRQRQQQTTEPRICEGQG